MFIVALVIALLVGIVFSGYNDGNRIVNFLIFSTISFVGLYVLFTAGCGPFPPGSLAN